MHPPSRFKPRLEDFPYGLSDNVLLPISTPISTSTTRFMRPISETGRVSLVKDRVSG